MTTLNTSATRNELIEWIRSLNDAGLLGSLLEIKKATQKGDWADALSDPERASIERGLDDLREGRRMISRDFWAGHGR